MSSNADRNRIEETAALILTNPAAARRDAHCGR
jgi:hypothetical protein